MAVGSLVCFSEGVKEGSGYRKYTIRQVQGPDDYLMMEEVLRRRFAKAPFPDLLVVDGGKGQLNKAVKVLQDLGPQQEIALLGIAKERKDEGDKIYKPGRKNPIMLAPHSPVLLFLMRVRDEAHRFGITFHRSLRQKQAFTSKLDSIPGIGPVRKKALLQAMGSLEQVAQASEKRLSEIPGIGADAAAGIYHYFHPEQTEESK
jgi:excinuclease ABC subunit C